MTTLRFRKSVIAVIGLGGTGSYLTDHLGRLLGNNSGALRSLNHALLINIDADIVSEANTARQNFTCRDIHEQKGLVLQRKLQQQYCVNHVDFWASYANRRLLERLMRKTAHSPLIVISCVDNHATRNRIMSFLKPDPDSWEGARQADWLYLDAGNDTTSGWSSAMGIYNGSGYGVDFRQQDIALRNNNVDQAPEIGEDGRERRGCGAVSSSPETYFCNQQNAYLLASQLRSICLFGKGYGIQAYTRPNFDSDSWQTESYQSHFLAPFTLD